MAISSETLTSDQLKVKELEEALVGGPAEEPAVTPVGEETVADPVVAPKPDKTPAKGTNTQELLDQMQADLDAKEAALAKAQGTIGELSGQLVEFTGASRRDPEGQSYTGVPPVRETAPQIDSTEIDPNLLMPSVEDMDAVLQGDRAKLRELLLSAAALGAEAGASDAMRRLPEQQRRTDQLRSKQESMRKSFYERHPDLDKPGVRDHVMLVTGKIFNHPQYSGKAFSQEIGDLIAQTARSNMGWPEPQRDSAGKVSGEPARSTKSTAPALGTRSQSGQRRNAPVSDPNEGLSDSQRKLKELEEYAVEQGLVKAKR